MGCKPVNPFDRFGLVIVVLAVPFILSHFVDARRMGELSGCCRGSKTRENGRFMDAKGMKRRTHPFRGQKNDDRTLTSVIINED